MPITGMSTFDRGAKMPRPYQVLKKNPNGTVTFRGTIPPALADVALELQGKGYNPNDWVCDGIRKLVREGELE